MPLSELCRFKQSGITQEYLHECFDRGLFCRCTKTTPSGKHA